MCVVDISCCDGNGTVFPTITQMPSSTNIEVWKTPVWQGKDHTGMVKPRKQSIAAFSHLFFHLFQSWSSNKETPWWTEEGSEEQFCWGSSGQLSSPDDECCWGASCAGLWKWQSITCGLTTAQHYAHGSAEAAALLFQPEQMNQEAAKIKWQAKGIIMILTARKRILTGTN